ncbi:MAG: helix-turn-helix domain-containing protein [Bacillota bacterium]
MATLLVHLKWSERTPMVEELLVNLYPNMQKEESSDTYMLFRIDENRLSLPLDDLYNLLVTDFQLRFTMLVVPEAASYLLPQSLWHSLMDTIKAGDYDLETAIIQGRRNLPDVFTVLKDRLNTLLSQTDITTVLALANANMNISTAAKRLFIHRNTMLYRLEHITRVSGIDVKTFKGLFILYSLYKVY